MLPNFRLSGDAVEEKLPFLNENHRQSAVFAPVQPASARVRQALPICGKDSSPLPVGLKNRRCSENRTAGILPSSPIFLMNSNGRLRPLLGGHLSVRQDLEEGVRKRAWQPWVLDTQNS